MAADSKYSVACPPLRNACGTKSGARIATTLNPYATATPSPISVNMFRLRLAIERQPRTSSGQPHQSTTGVASANCTQAAPCPARPPGDRPAIPAISKTTSGRVSASAIQKRRRMSTSSGSGPSDATGIAASSAMPHFGQLAGTGLSTPGHIGQT